MAKDKKKRIGKLAGILYSSNKKDIVKGRFFRELSPREILKSFPIIEKHRFFKELTNLNKKNFNTFYFSTCPNTAFEKSLFWIIGILKKYRNEINYLIQSELTLTEALLSAKYDSCYAILDEIDDTLGISMWSLSIRGNILSVQGDYVKKDSIQKELFDKAEKNNFLIGLMFYVFNRCNDNDSFITNTDVLSNQIMRSFDGEYLHFLLYKLCLNSYDFVYDYGHILNNEKNSSIIDMFYSVVDWLLGNQFNHRLDEEDLHIVVKALSDMFAYPPILSYANKIGIKTSWEFNNFEFNLLDLYTKGNYSAIVNDFVHNPHLFQEFQHFELLVKSAARVGTIKCTGLKQQLIDSLVSLILKDNNYDKSLSFLLWQCHGFSSLRWFRELHIFVEMESKNVGKSKERYLRELAILNSNLNSPRKSEIISPLLENTYKEECGAKFSNSTVYQLFYNRDNLENIDATIINSIEKHRYEKYLAKSLRRNNLDADAIPILVKLTNSDDILLNNETSRLLVESYIRVGDDLLAIKEFVNKCMQCKKLIQNYNTSVICSSAIKIAKVTDSIYIPVALSLHSRYVSNENDSALRFAFENFLMLNKVKKPLDNIDMYKKWPDDIVNFFLEKVCVPDVMKLYLEFNSTKEIEHCRIDLCNYLIQNEISKNELIQEVKERTKNLVISDAYKHVENSKIYSDTSVFFDESGRMQFMPIFDKFCELRKLDYSKYEDEQTLLKLYEVFKKIKSYDLMSSSHSIMMMNCPLNEKNRTFSTLLQRMRDEFTFGEKGLNHYLSTRIRHGHLPNTIRKSFTDEQLVTSKTAKTHNFIANTFWIKRIGCVDEDCNKKIEKIFSEFSSKVDDTIENLNDYILQINSLDPTLSNIAAQKNKSAAVFNYSISNIESFVLQKQLGVDADFNDFVKEIISWLWKRTERNLKAAREKISVEVGEQLHRLLLELQKDIYDLVEDKSKLTELNDAICRAKSNLTSNIEHILSWFTRSHEYNITHYEIETAIEIAKRAANALVEIKKDKQYILKGYTLSHFVDIIYIFIENAISKSNVQKDELKIEISLKTVGTKVNFSIENNCQQLDDIEKANKDLNYYRENYGIGNVVCSNTQREGGSGFFKVGHILNKTLRLSHDIDFGFFKKDCFRVNLTFYNLEEVIEHEDNVS